MTDWNRYHEFVGEKPNAIVAGVLADVPCGRDAALDLGAGNLRDSKFLKHSGFKRVVAVDSSEASLAYATPNIELVIAPLENYQPERGQFDLAISCNTLFFFKKPVVKRVIEVVRGGLKSGGVFAFNVLGELDGWAKDPDKSAFSEKEVDLLARRYKVWGISESQRILPTASGDEKFWHQWSLILIRS